MTFQTTINSIFFVKTASKRLIEVTDIFGICEACLILADWRQESSGRDLLMADPLEP